MTKHYPAFIVDAFSSTPFGGNPAAVCLIDDALSDARSLAIAREVNLSKTAFIARGEIAIRSPVHTFMNAVAQSSRPTARARATTGAQS
jgi:predicted PhzF superfamily epimerase YddE/YHI9